MLLNKLGNELADLVLVVFDVVAEAYFVDLDGSNVVFFNNFSKQLRKRDGDLVLVINCF